jgi:hypothetical protein
MLFSGFLLCKKFETYTQQQKHGTFVVYGSILYTQPNFMFSRNFHSVKRMKLYTLKAQKSMKFLSYQVSKFLHNKKLISSFMLFMGCYQDEYWVVLVCYIGWIQLTKDHIQLGTATEFRSSETIFIQKGKFHPWRLVEPDDIQLLKLLIVRHIWYTIFWLKLFLNRKI